MRSIPIIILCLLLLAPVTVGAQDADADAAIASFDLSLWPEYDRPALLVIYRGQFSAGTPLPLPVEFRIPAAAGTPFAVAWLDEQNQPIQQEYTTSSDGDWIVVAFELQSRGFQLEYYLPIPGAEGENPPPGPRSIAYTFTADYPTAILNVDILEPAGAQDFFVDPAADRMSTEGGLRVHLSQAGPLAQNKTASWTISYEMTAAAPQAAGSEAAGAAAPSQPAATTRSPTAGLLTAAVAALAMVAAGAGGYWLGRANSRAEEPAGKPAGKRRRAAARRAAGAAEAPYCYRCGAQLRAGADFCQQCGAAVRKTGG